ncbi:MAG: class I SAM-dependent methyltransferase [Steroidobacteraceae bacterium]|nr:class I SAM-dependent methyltransferase [Steroidobacteraceae bacterium]MDW8258230.1 class I SAM-dependent methyltransferase [Gammaproteobacteria bacterium]
MGEHANVFAAVPQGRHDLLVQPERDERARQEFVRSFKAHIQSGIVPGVHAAWASEVRPRFVAEFGREPRDRREIRELMVQHPLFQHYASLQRVSQELMWETVLGSVERESARLAARAAELRRPIDGRPLGSLTLDPTVQPPHYVVGVDIHCMPGGYCADHGADDVAAGALYDRGVYLYALGMMGPYNDDIGASAAKFVRERYPDFQPRRILDLGCTVGHSTLPWVDAFPQAEVHAIDVGAALLRYAHARAEALGKRVHFRQADATATPYPDGHFDLITSSILFHETSAQALPAILRECHRLLASGGIAVHGDLPPFWAMDEFNQFMFDCETHYNNEPYWSALREVDQVALSIQAGFAPDKVEFQLAPSAYRAAASVDRDFQAGEFAPGNAWQLLITRK